MDKEKNLTENNQSEEQAILTKEEILERSRKENSRGDERTDRAALIAGYFAMMVGGLISVVLHLLYTLLLNEAHPELFFVYSVMWSVFAWIEFHHLRRKIWLICAIAFTVAAIGCLILVILKFAGID